MVAVAAGCVVSDMTIPEGRYETPNRVEHVAIRDGIFELNVLEGRQRGQLMVTRKYRYKVWESGEIHILGSSNDVWFLDMTRRYKWVWNGAEVLRMDRLDASTERFVRRK
jgi:hypothetical protein